MTTWRVSVTPPAPLLGGWAPLTTRRVSVTQPGPQGPNKNNKFLTNHLDIFLALNLFFLYLTDEVEFGKDILQDCVPSYHLDV